MMVRVVSHFFQIIVLSAHPETFLGVGHAPVRSRLITQEPILELVHPRIGKHEGGIVLYYHGCRGNYSMSFLLKKIQEGLPNIA